MPRSAKSKARLRRKAQENAALARAAAHDSTTSPSPLPRTELDLVIRQTDERVRALFIKTHNLQVEVSELRSTVLRTLNAFSAFVEMAREDPILLQAITLDAINNSRTRSIR